MEKKNIHEWAAEMGYTLDESQPGNCRISDRPLTKEEFDKVFPYCKVIRIPDPQFSLSEHHEKNVEVFFRAAEASLLTKSWRQLSEELKSISDYINLMAKLNNEKKAKENPGSGTGQAS
jgi:hypothetical protein